MYHDPSTLAMWILSGFAITSGVLLTGMALRDMVEASRKRRERLARRVTVPGRMDS